MTQSVHELVQSLDMDFDQAVIAELKAREQAYGAAFSMDRPKADYERQERDMAELRAIGYYGLI